MAAFRAGDYGRYQTQSAAPDRGISTNCADLSAKDREAESLRDFTGLYDTIAYSFALRHVCVEVVGQLPKLAALKKRVTFRTRLYRIYVWRCFTLDVEHSQADGRSGSCPGVLCREIYMR